jgi:hypothetical protein
MDKVEQVFTTHIKEEEETELPKLLAVSEGRVVLGGGTKGIHGSLEVCDCVALVLCQPASSAPVIMLAAARLRVPVMCICCTT